VKLPTGRLKLACAVPEALSAEVAYTAPFTISSTVPVALLPPTVAVAVNAVPKVVVAGTPDKLVDVVTKLPAFTVIKYGAVVR
jgi:hypothetical protein